jgi:5'-3' exonuclease
MSRTLIIDGNSVGYAAHHATKLTSGSLQTQAIFGFIKTMRELRTTYIGYQIIVLWDGKAQWRFDLCPEYKSNRDNDPKKKEVREAYAEQRPYITKALKYLGIRQMTASTHEADDLAGLLVSQLMAKEGNEVVLITGDGDWLQLVRPGVTWRDLRDDAKIVTMKNFTDYTGCKTPYGFLEAKCLQGDSSDCISGVGGIGEKGAPEFIAEFGSVRAFWAQCDDGSFIPTKKPHVNLWKGRCDQTKEQWAINYTGDDFDDKAIKKYMSEWPGQGRIIFNRNLRMMQLLKVVKPDPKDVTIVSEPLNKIEFEGLCQELNFASITRNLDHFCSPFEGK